MASTRDRKQMQGRGNQVQRRPTRNVPFALASGWAIGFVFVVDGVARMETFEQSNPLFSLYPPELGSWVVGALACGLAVALLVWLFAKSSGGQFAPDVSVGAVLSVSAFMAGRRDGFMFEYFIQFDMAVRAYILLGVPAVVVTYLVAWVGVRLWANERYRLRRILGGVGVSLTYPTVFAALLGEAGWLPAVALASFVIGLVLVGTGWTWVQIVGLALMAVFTLLGPALLVASSLDCMYEDCRYTHRYQSMFGIALVWLSLMPVNRANRVRMQTPISPPRA